MNKQEWLDCNDIEILLREISNRKKRLFALACCRRVEHLLLDQRSKDCLEKTELFIDGKIDEKELELAKEAARSAAWNAAWNAANAAWSVYYAANNYAILTVYYVASTYEKKKKEDEKHIEILKDIYNPYLENLKFSSLAISLADQVYNGDDSARFDLRFSQQAISLAEQVYNGDNDARGVLSDYLEENNYPEELYLHLKQSNHYKGCWLIDQILEKT